MADVGVLHVYSSSRRPGVAILSSSHGRFPPKKSKPFFCPKLSPIFSRKRSHMPPEQALRGCNNALNIAIARNECSQPPCADHGVLQRHLCPGRNAAVRRRCVLAGQGQPFPPSPRAAHQPGRPLNPRQGGCTPRTHRKTADLRSHTGSWVDGLCKRSALVARKKRR